MKKRKELNQKMNKDLNLDLEKEIEELTIPCKYKNDNWLCTIKRYRA